MRGEQPPFHVIPPCALGSPPLARGTGSAGLPSRARSGITPACAGNRVIATANSLMLKDHPRLRGEQQSELFDEVITKGSPPLARGTGRFFKPLPLLRRITPACAGNSHGKRKVRYVTWDHPRLRGEQFQFESSTVKGMGSPPLARGTGGLDGARDKGNGITPACAGNS